MVRFSPHTRGCSWFNPNHIWVRVVFPAYAGMFRVRSTTIVKVQGFPRIRGDVPERHGERRCYPRFSPHTRGCSSVPKPIIRRKRVFPAYAGMFRIILVEANKMSSFPRIRGDVPMRERVRLWREEFSPHTRGCSAPKPKGVKATIVFPAYAGMFRIRLRDKESSKGFPRIRGDVPQSPTEAQTLPAFSPHTRGCS